MYKYYTQSCITLAARRQAYYVVLQSRRGPVYFNKRSPFKLESPCMCQIPYKLSSYDD